MILLSLHFRNLIRIWDFEETRQHYEDDRDFVYLVISQLLLLYCNLNYLLVFTKKTLRQKIYTPFLTISIILSSQVGVYGRDEFISKLGVVGAIALFCGFVVGQNLNHCQNINRELFDEMTKKVDEQSQFRQIINHLEESILISCDNKIELVNDDFLLKFNKYITEPITLLGNNETTPRI